MSTLLKIKSFKTSSNNEFEVILTSTSPVDLLKKHRHDLHNAINGIADFVSMINSGETIDSADMSEIALSLKDKLAMIQSEVALTLEIYKKAD